MYASSEIIIDLNLFFNEEKDSSLVFNTLLTFNQKFLPFVILKVEIYHLNFPISDLIRRCYGVYFVCMVFCCNFAESKLFRENKSYFLIVKSTRHIFL